MPAEPAKGDVAQPLAPEKDKADVGKKEAGKEAPVADEADKELIDELNSYVDRLETAHEASVVQQTLESLCSLIRSSTTSMTAVPKPLKYLRPQFGRLKTACERVFAEPGRRIDARTKALFADVISVLAMAVPDGGQDCLKFWEMGSRDEIGAWGHEYVRHLATEVVAQWHPAEAADKETKKDRSGFLLDLVRLIVPYHMQHNAEHEACDLLMEIEQLSLLSDYVDASNCSRVCLYLTSCVPFVPSPENSVLLQTAMNLYMHCQRPADALRCALALGGDVDTVRSIFNCPMARSDKALRRQLAFMLARHQLFLVDGANAVTCEEDESDQELAEILSNSHLNAHFLSLARELDILEPKIPEDIYKSHLIEGTSRGLPAAAPDSARQNLASSFVNAFVNAGFGRDRLLLGVPGGTGAQSETADGMRWLAKQKEQGAFSTAASLGLLLLWDVAGGLTAIDKYLYSNEEAIKGGALLACGVVNAGVRNDCDPALALLGDYTSHNSLTQRVGSLFGLGLAYACSGRADVLAAILPTIRDTRAPLEAVAVAGLAAGLVGCGKMDGSANEALLEALMERPETQLREPLARLLALGLGLLYLSCQDACTSVIDTISAAVQEPSIRAYATTLVTLCAYVGTGNVLRVQQMMHEAADSQQQTHEQQTSSKEGEKSEKSGNSGSGSGSSRSGSDKSSKQQQQQQQQLCGRQGVAVLGVAAIAMGEDVGTDMAMRTIGHLLRYGDASMRRAAPLALALLSPSNPRLNILDTLQKLSHDADSDVASCALLALGIVGAGTNNARLAASLRQLAALHAKDPNALFTVRIAQGLVHLGKGTMTLNPFHSDRMLAVPAAVAGLLCVLIPALDIRHTILGRLHYLLFGLSLSIQPRLLVTLDESLRPLPATVRVGQAVDVVGQAGRPKTITGFQTHTTPVLLAYGERAELAAQPPAPASTESSSQKAATTTAAAAEADEEYTSLAPVLEGFVILRKESASRM